MGEIFFAARPAWLMAKKALEMMIAPRAPRARGGYVNHFGGAEVLEAFPQLQRVAQRRRHLARDRA